MPCKSDFIRKKYFFHCEFFSIFLSPTDLIFPSGQSSQIKSDSDESLFFSEGSEMLELVNQGLCLMNLRGEKHVPGRQMLKDKEKAKEIYIEANENDILNDRPKLASAEYNILSHLKKIPALLSVYDALMMSQELRDVLIYALQHPQKFHTFFTEIDIRDIHQVSGITFTDEDLLLGIAKHNRPLYVSGALNDIKVRRILIDPGSSINIIIVRTLRSISLGIEYLAAEKIFVQGFDQNTQQTLGSIYLELKLGELNTETKFHVIDADASYKVLLGRSWLHQNQVIPSTLHQCLKYTKNVLRKFSHVENSSYFQDRYEHIDAEKKKRQQIYVKKLLLIEGKKSRGR